jgi:hypothetical protein
VKPQAGDHRFSAVRDLLFIVFRNDYRVWWSFPLPKSCTFWLCNFMESWANNITALRACTLVFCFATITDGPSGIRTRNSLWRYVINISANCAGNSFYTSNDGANIRNYVLCGHNIFLRYGVLWLSLVSGKGGCTDNWETLIIQSICYIELREKNKTK